MRKTKIICTLGPACRDRETLLRMLDAGMNVARMNFSHQDHDFHRQNIRLLDELREERGVPLALMLDTRGPEIRTGMLDGGEIALADGNDFVLTTRSVTGNERLCQVSCEGLPAALHSGDRILLDDGKLELAVRHTAGTEIVCTVVRGGVLGNRRGVNLPDVTVPMPFLSAQDQSDLRLGIAERVDFVAASFVRTAADVRTVRDFLSRNGGEEIRVIAKIENRSAIEDFDAILREADGIMIARGDMGVEIPYEQLPGIQKRLIRKCYECGKFAIVATQMLENMIGGNPPTRAEITDVANAVFDSCSAVMLSGETAIGKDPAFVVRTMGAICEQAERDAFSPELARSSSFPHPTGEVTDAICDAAVLAAADADADAVLAVTRSGVTAQLMSKYRPAIPIIGATDRENVYHRLSVNWGVIPLRIETQSELSTLLSHAVARAVNAGLLHRGQRVVIAAGDPTGISGKTNLLRLVRVE